jgi:hypothetical protein
VYGAIWHATQVKRSVAEVQADVGDLKREVEKMKARLGFGS